MKHLPQLLVVATSLLFGAMAGAAFSVTIIRNRGEGGEFSEIATAQLSVLAATVVGAFLGALGGFIIAAVFVTPAEDE